MLKFDCILKMFKIVVLSSLRNAQVIISSQFTIKYDRNCFQTFGYWLTSPLIAG